MGVACNLCHAAALCRAFAHHLVKIVVYRLDEDAAAEGFEPVGAVGLDGVVVGGDDLLAEQHHDYVVDPDAVELDDVIDEHGTVVVVAVHDAHVGVDARLDERALHLAIEHAVAVVEHGIGRVGGRMLASLVKLVLLGQEMIERVEVDFGGQAFPSAQCGGNVAHDDSLGGTDLGAVVLQSMDGLIDQRAKGLVLGGEHEQQRLLVFYLLANHILNPFHSIGREGKRQLSLADGGYGAILRAPYPRHGLAGAVAEDDFDLVLHGQEYGIARDLGTLAELDGGDASHRNALPTVTIADYEALVVSADGDAKGVEYQLHKPVLVVVVAETGKAKLGCLRAVCLFDHDAGRGGADAGDAQTE